MIKGGVEVSQTGIRETKSPKSPTVRMRFLYLSTNLIWNLRSFADSETGTTPHQLQNLPVGVAVRMRDCSIIAVPLALPYLGSLQFLWSWGLWSSNKPSVIVCCNLCVSGSIQVFRLAVRILARTARRAEHRQQAIHTASKWTRILLYCRQS